MTTEITLENFTAAMKAAVLKRGAEYVYPDNLKFAQPSAIGGGSTQTCMYSNAAGEPLCLIGAALFELDPKLLPDSNLVESASSVLVDLGVSDGTKGWRLLSAADAAQNAQDTGLSWGTALNTFLEVAKIEKSAADLH